MCYGNVERMTDIINEDVKTSLSGIGVLNFTPSLDASRYLQSQRLSYSSIVSLPNVSSAINGSTLYRKQYCPEMFNRFSQQSLISFSSTFVSSAAERIDLAIATNSPEALKISICGCFSDILYWAVLFPRTKLVIFSPSKSDSDH